MSSLTPFLYRRNSEAVYDRRVIFMENEYTQYNREELLKIIEKQNLRIDVLNQMHCRNMVLLIRICT